MTHRVEGAASVAKVRVRVGASAAVAAGLIAATLLPVNQSMAAERLLETGTFVKIADGDTIVVNIQGVERVVRFTGVNTLEIVRDPLTGGRVECGAAQASSYMRSLLPVGAPVRLYGNDPNSRSRGRLLRTVKVDTGQGFIDPQVMVARAGLALWWPDVREGSNRLDIRRAVDAARAEGRGIWNPTNCGRGPNADAPLSMMLVWDAFRSDGKNRNGQYAIIRNHGNQNLSLAGWRFRDSTRRAVNFPSWAKIPAKGHILVHMGRGQARGNHFYVNGNTAKLPNPAPGKWIGDGGYLQDPLRNIRASYLYPCVPGAVCADPARGNIAIVKKKLRKYVRIRNTGTKPLALEGYYVQFSNLRVPVNVGVVVPPGKKFDFYIGKGTSTRTRQYVGVNRNVLHKRTPFRVITPQDQVIASRWVR